MCDMHLYSLLRLEEMQISTAQVEEFAVRTKVLDMQAR